jgi:hypothetical protein
MPNCTDPKFECSWVWNTGAEKQGERFRIKILNGGCRVHNGPGGEDPPVVEDAPAAEPSDEQVRAWLTGDAA